MERQNNIKKPLPNAEIVGFTADAGIGDWRYRGFYTVYIPDANCYADVMRYEPDGFYCMQNDDGGIFTESDNPCEETVDNRPTEEEIIDFVKDYVQQTKMVVTTDNWYPNYPDNKVMVRLNTTGDDSSLCIWGADDYALELKGKTAQLRDICDNIPEPVTIQWAFDHGFEQW